MRRTRFVMEKIVSLFQKWFGRKAPALAPASELTLQDRFTQVYDQRMWASAESASGPGSELASGSVRHSIETLRRMVRELGVRSLTDVPCGDFNWMPEFLKEHPEIDYVGYDIVAPMIAANRQRWPERNFAVLDITREVPRGSDLLFSKDMLNHLAEKDVWAALANMIASGSRYVMATNNQGFENEELEPSMAHASRFLDLFAAPYLMPPPLYNDHYLILWERDVLAARMAERCAAAQ